MSLSQLMALSPVDGRYHMKTRALAPFFSEYGLIHYRLKIEIAWFCSLAALPEIPELPPLSEEALHFLTQIAENFSEKEALEIKTIEATLNHDLKALEYYLKNTFQSCPELAPLTEFIHFACTSEDINNLAYACMIKEACIKIMYPRLHDLFTCLHEQAQKYADLPMLSRTHGQAATPTTLGKEFANFAARLQDPMVLIQSPFLKGKINGAVGNFNAHCVAYPKIDWLAHNEAFVKSLGLSWNPYTTQIEPHDAMVALFQVFQRINSILIDLARDFWGYISLGYFKQKAVETEVGSSTMPHKINPIDFENAEGNLGVANALFTHLVSHLPLSRWQRDLTDSTLLRNIGTAFAHSLIGYTALLSGFQKIAPEKELIQAQLASHWDLLSEAVQTVMRRAHLPAPYEQLKAFTRGKKIDEASLHAFIQQLNLAPADKEALLALTPATYTGLAERLARNLTPKT